MLPSLCCAPPSPLLQASCSDAFTPERWGVAGAIAAALKAVPKSAAELLPWRAGAAPPAPALSASCSSPSCVEERRWPRSTPSSLPPTCPASAEPTGWLGLAATPPPLPLPLRRNVRRG
eukprot:scaffold117762_cov14-Tisochrysis_lutea.AAC.1